MFDRYSIQQAAHFFLRANDAFENRKPFNKMLGDLAFSNSTIVHRQLQVRKVCRVYGNMLCVWSRHYIENLQTWKTQGTCQTGIVLLSFSLIHAYGFEIVLCVSLAKSLNFEPIAVDRLLKLLQCPDDIIRSHASIRTYNLFYSIFVSLGIFLCLCVCLLRI